MKRKYKEEMEKWRNLIYIIYKNIYYIMEKWRNIIYNPSICKYTVNQTKATESNTQCLSSSDSAFND